MCKGRGGVDGKVQCEVGAKARLDYVRSEEIRIVLKQEAVVTQVKRRRQ